MELSSVRSEGDVEDTGDNPERPAHGNEEARKLRMLLLEFTTEAEKIKGRVYGAEAVEKRWNKHLVMSTDGAIMEMHTDGSATDIANMVEMANTTWHGRARRLSGHATQLRDVRKQERGLLGSDT